MALVRYESPSKLTFATLGNIGIRAWGPGLKLQFLAQRGFLNGRDPKVQEHEVPWDLDWLLLMFTDGISDRWKWDDFPGIERASTPEIARRLLTALAIEDDDASVIAIRRKR